MNPRAGAGGTGRMEMALTGKGRNGFVVSRRQGAWNMTSILDILLLICLLKIPTVQWHT